MPNKSPVLYIPHGGGPLPLLDDKEHKSLIAFLKGLDETINTPSAIIVISAHWESSKACITAHPTPELIFDYYNFPASTYKITYPAPGEPKLAKSISQRLIQLNIPSAICTERGWDHGVYVPLKLAWPDANIPVIQLSLLEGLDAQEHIALGEALSEFSDQNILIIGSGMSFHNMDAMFTHYGKQQSEDFNRWLKSTLTSKSTTYEEKKDLLIHWHQAPSAEFCHPRSEHLTPLFVCFGAAKNHNIATVPYDDDLMGKKVISTRWN